MLRDDGLTVWWKGWYVCRMRRILDCVYRRYECVSKHLGRYTCIPRTALKIDLSFPQTIGKKNTVTTHATNITRRPITIKTIKKKNYVNDFPLPHSYISFATCLSHQFSCFHFVFVFFRFSTCPIRRTPAIYTHVSACRLVLFSYGGNGTYPCTDVHVHT